MTADNKIHKNNRNFLIFNGGDLSIDYHIQVKNELRKELKYVTNSNGIAFLQIGNAFFTGKLLKTAFSNDKVNPKVEICELYEAPTETNIIGLPSTFSIIRKYTENDNGTQNDKPSWRISEYLGRSNGNKKKLNKPYPDNYPNVQPDVLILSEYSHDFRRKGAHWPNCIDDGKDLPLTFLRCSNPLICKKEENELLDHLLSKGNAKDNLILLTTIDDLRHSDIYIKHGLSWESTALSLVKAFNSSKFNHLRESAYVIITIGRFGAFLYHAKGKPGEKYSLFYSRDAIEDNNDMEFAGSSHGLNTGLLVNVVFSCVQRLRKSGVNTITIEMIREGLLSGLCGISRAFEAGFSLQGIKTLETESFEDIRVNGEKVQISESKRKLEDKAVEEPRLDDLIFPVRELFNENKLKDPDNVITPNLSGNFAWISIPSYLSLANDNTWDILSEHGRVIKKKCHEIIRSGDIRNNLENIPHSSFGEHIVIGRKEIEESREIKKLIASYTQKRTPKKPLSIAVFGEPGSGKSHSIEKIASSIFKTKETILKFNLSQIAGKKSLLEAFHLIRDAAIEGKTVIVIWDEFDTFFENEDFGWVKYFLGPMQDGIFYEGSIAHPLGQSIFFFLSSKYRSLAEITEITRKIKIKSSENLSNKAGTSLKLLDFISRLQGHIEIPGINPAKGKNKISPELLLRRGIILRSLIKKHCPTIFQINDEASIDSGLIAAFLEIEEYYYGTRSMEAIITMSHIDGKSRFNRSCLPDNSQLSLHVNDKSFWNLINSSKELG